MRSCFVRDALLLLSSLPPFSNTSPLLSCELEYLLLQILPGPVATLSPLGEIDADDGFAGIVMSWTAEDQFGHPASESVDISTPSPAMTGLGTVAVSGGVIAPTINCVVAGDYPLTFVFSLGYTSVSMLTVVHVRKDEFER